MNLERRSHAPIPVGGLRARAYTIVVVFGAAVLFGCGDSNSSGDASVDQYQATIRRTAYGVPHIVANDWGGLGFGQGYAVAEDHVCTIADQIIKVRSERSLFFGRGENDRHLNSDLAYLALDVYGRAERSFPSQPDDVKDLLTGYAAGYNAFLADTPTNMLPGWCGGQDWVRPITPVDLAAYWGAIAIFGSGGQFIDLIATAQPPGSSAAAGTVTGNQSAMVPDFKPDIGSNGWAIGAERSVGGRGMLVANPHFPWEGELRFWESQLTIPGTLNVYGASLIGLAGVQIGFNENVAWTHTVSAGVRFTVYTLDLVPGNPTTYMYDGSARPMTSRDFTVSVRESDNSLTEVTRTLYFSHYGPIINFPGIGWSTDLTLTYRDANVDNHQLIPQFIGMDKANTLADLQRVHAETQGIPWINTIAASQDGTTWYADTSATPNLSAEAIAAWQQARASDPLVGAAYSLGVVLLDGSRSLFEWVDAPDARDHGLIPFSGMPQLERADYVFNANDSHWMANPAVRIQGFSPLQGEERTPLGPRTRRNVLTLSDLSPNGPSGSDGRFSLAELQAAILRNRGLIAELLQGPVVERCTGADPVTIQGETIDVDAACEVLAQWDGRLDLESAGAVLWREFVTSFSYADLTGMPEGTLFAQPFHPDDPIGTPSGLAPAPLHGNDLILQRLGLAVRRLHLAGIALDATLGDLQYSVREPSSVPIHGGTGLEGVENVVEVGTGGLKTSLEPEPPIGPAIDGSYSLTATGYPIAFGTSFLLAMEYTDNGPRAASVLTYSESGDPRSPHYADQGELFSRKEWKAVAFTEEDIAADPTLETITITGGRSSERTRAVTAHVAP